MALFANHICRSNWGFLFVHGNRWNVTYDSNTATNPIEEKLQQLGGASTNGQRTAGGASSAAAGGIAGAASSGFKTKRSLNNSDRRTLLYNYYSRGLAPMYDKRNFDEIDRFARFNGKRNLDYEPSYTGSADHGYNGRFSKRNFDEIDRFNGKFASTAKCDIALKLLALSLSPMCALKECLASTIGLTAMTWRRSASGTLTKSIGSAGSPSTSATSRR